MSVLGIILFVMLCWGRMVGWLIGGGTYVPGQRAVCRIWCERGRRRCSRLVGDWRGVSELF